MDTNHSERRVLFLVDKNFQYRQILVAVLTVVITTNLGIVGSYFIFGDLFVEHLLSLGWVLAAIIFAEVVIILSVIYYGIRSSHKIVGPVFVIKRSLESLGNGDLSTRAHFRKSDKLQDLCTAFNDAAERLESTINAITRDFHALRTALEQGKPHDEHLQKLTDSLGKMSPSRHDADDSSHAC